jgi:hypothetical protein
MIIKNIRDLKLFLNAKAYEKRRFLLAVKEFVDKQGEKENES